MILQNNTKRLLIYTLSHEETCTDACGCTAQEHLQQVHNPKTGDRSVRMLNLSVPVSLYIPGGEQVEAPDSALGCKQIKADVAAKILTVKKGS